MPFLNRAQAESIIQAGILAPSADNHHMVRFSIDDDVIRVMGDAAYAAAPFHRRVLALISLGAVVENMLVRASALGLGGIVSWDPGASTTGALAIVRFSTSAGASEGELGAAIAQRHTNRRVLFRGPTLSDAQQKCVTEDAECIPGVRLLWLDEPALRRQALRLITTAEAERFGSQPLHADLFAGIRFDVGWRTSVTEGLPPGALEIEPPMRPLFRQLRLWGWMRLLAALGVHRMIGFRAAYAPCRTAPHLCVLTTTLELDPGTIAVGRALERVWLRATALGFAFQPLAASALLALEGYRDVDGAVRRRLAEGWKAITADGLPLMVFRMGHAASASIRAGRPPVDAFLAERRAST